MTRLLIVRHGNSQANAQGIFAGFTDSPLTELGLLQAEKTASYIAENYQVDAVYASDLQRAFVTGKAVADKLGLPVTPTKAMREIFAGQWEGQAFDELDKLPSYHTWKTDIGNATCDGGESVRQLQSRVLTELTRIARENPGKTVVIVSHGTPIRAIQCFCQGKSLEEMKDIPWVSNASVTELCYEDEKFTPVSVGYDAHLEGVRSVLPANC